MGFLFNIFLAVFAFLILNTGATTANVSGWLQISVFVILFVKIEMQR